MLPFWISPRASSAKAGERLAQTQNENTPKFYTAAMSGLIALFALLHWSGYLYNRYGAMNKRRLLFMLPVSMSRYLNQTACGPSRFSNSNSTSKGGSEIPGQTGPRVHICRACITHVPLPEHKYHLDDHKCHLVYRRTCFKMRLVCRVLLLICIYELIMTEGWLLQIQPSLLFLL